MCCWLQILKLLQARLILKPRWASIQCTLKSAVLDVKLLRCSQRIANKGWSFDTRRENMVSSHLFVLLGGLTTNLSPHWERMEATYIHFILAFTKRHEIALPRMSMCRPGTPITKSISAINNMPRWKDTLFRLSGYLCFTTTLDLVINHKKIECTFFILLKDARM